ncbi:cell division protein ZapE [Candidatus Deianiraea vastatrix]|uniref:Cell division protein ZapE-like ATPase n=1 Tax=Candidatus Deianiraea vastatrix TaxID=2163644 RepID=A0A5B8XEP0_9RICK|nr:cell division protein ZapE [Candidatus Deianiraea vastatrix]QED23710.1 Cell division protein ZapE-like ATPase [Candidatus Deianiraea vastatrix]
MEINFDARQRELLEVLSGYKAKRRFWQRGRKSGVYIYGGVGRGKTMIMDVFFKEARYRNKMRMHLIELMQEVSRFINEGKELGYADPMMYVFKRYRHLGLLCIDEFEVLDVVSSVLIRRLLIFLGKRGCILVITSNTYTSDLYANGLQRERFLELIEYFNRQMEVFYLDSGCDYRGLMDGSERNFIISKDKQEGFIRQILWGNGLVEYEEIDFSFKRVGIEHCNGMALIDFEEFCKKPYGARDYAILCGRFERFVIYNIEMPSEDRNALLRFICLIDILYDGAREIKTVADFNYREHGEDIASSMPILRRAISRVFS